ncbi:MAG: response regulator [Chromatiales bacterium]|nr:response regulator [Chromatiales bacterium]
MTTPGREPDRPDSAPPARSPRQRLLLVEDNPADVLLFSEAVRETACALDVQIAPDGEAALRALRANRDDPPDLVVLDLDLPRKTGIEVLDEIASEPALRALPVVVLTTSGTEEDIRRCEQRGIRRYARKPVHFSDLTALVVEFEALARQVDRRG